MTTLTTEGLKKITSAYTRGRKLVKEGTWTRKTPPPKGWVRGGNDSRIAVMPQKLEEACAVFREGITVFMTYDVVEELSFALESLGKYQEAAALWHDAIAVATERQHQDKIARFKAEATRLEKKVGKAEWMVEAAASPTPPARDAGEPARAVAQAFADALVSGKFDAANALLTSAARKKLSPAQLKKSYAKMTSHFESPATTAIVEEFVTEGELVKAGDVAWAYVSIAGDEDPEAVTVTISEEAGKPLIRDVEWGRP